MNSTLYSSGVFIKNDLCEWYYKEKEALDYILKINEKILTMKLNKETKLNQKKIKNKNLNKKDEDMEKSKSNLKSGMTGAGTSLSKSKTSQNGCITDINLTNTTYNTGQTNSESKTDTKGSKKDKNIKL